MLYLSPISCPRKNSETQRHVSTARKHSNGRIDSNHDRNYSKCQVSPTVKARSKVGIVVISV
jgi:hypothetical protein